MVGEKGWRKVLVVLGFLLPNALGFLLFSLVPVVGALVLTLFKWDLLTPPIWVGLSNFARLLQDREFHSALGHTVYFIAGYIPLVVVCGLGLALALNQKLVLRGLFRTAFFLPVVSSWVAVALIWAWLFNPVYGVINYGLSLLHIAGPQWLYDTHWAMPAIIITSVWKDMGYVTVFYLAGLQGIASEYYEAAGLDGATAFQKLRHVTIPLLAPTSFFVLVILLINSFQVFEQVYVMTKGGPLNSTNVLVSSIFDNAFKFGKMGYAAAQSWVLFLLVFAATVVQMRLQKRWVQYE